MQIFFCCSLSLQFAVYVDFVSSSSWRAGPSSVAHHPAGSNLNIDQECECMNIDGYDILMKRDPETKELLYIRLRDENTQWLSKKTSMVHVIVQRPDLEFVAFVSANTGRWLGLTAMNEFHRRALRVRQAPVFRTENPIKSITLCDCLPDKDPIPSLLHSESSFSSNVPPPEKTTPHEQPHSREMILFPIRSPPFARAPSPARASLPARTSVPANSIVRGRSRSASSVHSFTDIFGFKLEELRFIRLIPNRNQNKTYELQKYIFPSDGRIQLRAANSVLIPMPTEEQIVLAASNGDIFAILEKYHKQVLLRGMYKPVYESGVRAKINIYSGAVEELTREESIDCRIGTSNGVAKFFRIYRV